MSRPNPPWMVLATIATALALSRESLACCGPPPDADTAAKEAAAIFLGRVVGGGTFFHPISCATGWLRVGIGLEPAEEDCLSGYLKFEVMELFKGELGKSATLDSGVHWEGSPSALTGTTLLVYAPAGKDGRPWFSVCGRNLDGSRMEPELTMLRERYRQ